MIRKPSGVKHEQRVKDPETGEEKQTPEYFYGYKAHMSYNPARQLMTSVETTSGEKNDGQ